MKMKRSGLPQRREKNHMKQAERDYSKISANNKYRMNIIMKLNAIFGFVILLTFLIAVPLFADANLDNMVEAAQTGNIAKVTAGLKAGANVNAVSGWGYTAIVSAARAGKLDMVKFLVSKGANINQPDSSGITALMNASSDTKNNELVKFLLSKGADTTLQDKDQNASALMYASRSGAVENAKLLVAANANVKYAAKGGVTALHWAAENGWVPMVTFLLEKGADIEAKNSAGQTALFLPGIFNDDENHLACVRALLEKGAVINAVDNDKRTPLMIAISHAHPATAALLLSKKADVNLADKLGQTALIHCVSRGTNKDSTAIFKLLMAVPGINVNAREIGPNGQTALKKAYVFSGKNSDFAKALLAAGATE
jgi:ankyrin repeat protein